MASEKTWPPSNGLSTPTIPRSDAILTIAASTTISAPAEQVFSTLLDTSTYPSWCTFVPRVEIRSQPPGVDSPTMLHLGTKFTFYAIMGSSGSSKGTPRNLSIFDISTPDKPSDYVPTKTLEGDASYTTDLSRVYRVSWGGGGGLFEVGPRSERFHEVIVTGPNECEVRCWEIMGGVLARVVGLMYKDTLQKKFEDWNKDLKGYCENKAGNPELP